MILKRVLPIQVKRTMVYLNILRWIREFKSLEIKEPSDNILVCAVVSHFWVLEMVFYALHLKAIGKDVTLLVNRDVLGANLSLLLILKKLRSVIDVKFYNSNNKTKNNKDYNQTITRQKAINNICYKEKIEYYDQIVEDNKSLYIYFLNEYTSTYETIDEILTTKRFQKVVVPSGFIYESAPIYDYCKKTGIKVITVETYCFKTAKRIIGVNEIAVKDFSGLENLKMTDEIEEYIVDYMHYQEKPIEELERKTSYLAYQNSSCELIPDRIKTIIENGKPNILIATTVTGDSSTIGVFSPFRTQSEWIKEIIYYFSKMECNVFVRIHPVEKLVKPKLQLDKLLHSYLDEMDIKNVLIITPEDTLNTFALVSQMKLVLTWVSTISVDFVLRDKPVLLAAQAPFYNFGFCYYEETKEKYFERLVHLFTHECGSSSNTHKILAKLYIYFLFKYRVYTIDQSPGKMAYENYSLLQENSDLNKLLTAISYS